MNRRLVVCALLLGTSAAISLQCASFSGTDSSAAGPSEAGADAAIATDAGDVVILDGGSTADGSKPGPPVPFCASFPDAALCLDFEGNFPPVGFSKDSNADLKYLALTDGGHSPPSAFLSTVLTSSAYAQLYQDNVIGIPDHKILHFSAQVRAPMSAYSNTEVDLFLLEIPKPSVPSAFFLILDHTSAGYTATFNYGHSASSDGGPLCADPTASVPTVPGEWFSVDVLHEPVSNLITVKINGKMACGAMPASQYLPAVGAGAQAPFRADLGIGYAFSPPESVAIDDVLVTFE